MIRILPDMQVSPAGGILMWLFIGLVAIGFLFATGTGGAIIWAAFWALVLFVAYIILKRIGRVIF